MDARVTIANHPLQSPRLGQRDGRVRHQIVNHQLLEGQTDRVGRRIRDIPSAAHLNRRIEPEARQIDDFPARELCPPASDIGDTAIREPAGKHSLLYRPAKHHTANELLLGDDHIREDGAPAIDGAMQIVVRGDLGLRPSLLCVGGTSHVHTSPLMIVRIAVALHVPGTALQHDVGQLFSVLRQGRWHRKGIGEIPG